jgi:hypothetical protein
MAPDVGCWPCYDLLTKMKDSKLDREEQKNLQKPGEGKRPDKTRQGLGFRGFKLQGNLQSLLRETVAPDVLLLLLLLCLFSVERRLEPSPD